MEFSNGAGEIVLKSRLQFPCVVSFWVILPFDEVFKAVVGDSRGKDFFKVPIFSSDMELDARWFGSTELIFDEASKLGYVKSGMNLVRLR